MSDRVRVIGLTGGIASGKSAVAQMLRERGAQVIDADLLARQVVVKGQPAFVELVARFGDGVVGADGELDRKRLGAIAFADAQARADLNRITHPRIAAASQAEIARLAQAGWGVVFYEAALLVENRAQAWLDALIVVAAPRELQRARVVARDRIAEPDADARLDAQLPLDKKLEAATWVIDNAGDLAATELQVEIVLREVVQRFGSITLDAVGAGSNGKRHSTSGVWDTIGDTDSGPPPPERVLVTGFPAYTAQRMIKKLVTSDSRVQVRLLARAKFADDAAAFTRGLPPGQRERVSIVVGDVCDMDLGLTAAEYRALIDELTSIHHLAGVYWAGVDPATARRVNVGGTRGVVELAGECKRLRRVVHWSTVQVSGKRRGVVLEDELDLDQGFYNAYEQTKFDAERIMQAATAKLPITILRPGMIVGDSTTGEIDRFDGPYYFIVMIATNALQVHLPLPGRGTAPLHLVPIDYVVDAAHALWRDERAAGRTFHIVDPNPLPARRVYELVAQHSQTKAPRGYIPGRIAKALLRAPGVGRVAKGPLAYVDAFDHQVFYNQRNTQELLGATGLVCPPIEGYLEHLVKYVREMHATKKRTIEDETFDPFD